MITRSEIENNEQANNSCADDILQKTGRYFAVARRRHIEELSSIVVELERNLSFYVMVERAENNRDFAVGRLAGIIETFSILLDMAETFSISSSSLDSAYSQIKTMSKGEDILNKLDFNRGIQHKDLSKELGLTKSALTYTMDKLEDFNIVYHTNLGKYKFYYLTDLGRKLKEDSSAQNHISNEKLNQIVERLSSENNIIKELNVHLVEEHKTLRNQIKRLKAENEKLESNYDRVKANALFDNVIQQSQFSPQKLMKSPTPKMVKPQKRILVRNSDLPSIMQYLVKEINYEDNRITVKG